MKVGVSRLRGVVRAGLPGRGLLIPVEQVAEVIPAERRVVTRAAPRPTSVLRGLRRRPRTAGGGG